MSLDTPAPQLNSAMSTPSNDSGVISCTVRSPAGTWPQPKNGSFLPAERALASARTSLAGKSRSCSTCRNSLPTAPVAPATATTGFAGIFLVHVIDRSPLPRVIGWRSQSARGAGVHRIRGIAEVKRIGTRAPGSREGGVHRPLAASSSSAGRQTGGTLAAFRHPGGDLLALSCVSSKTLSESRSNAVCRHRTAAAACAPSTTTDRRMGDVEMARMLMWFSPSVEKPRGHAGRRLHARAHQAHLRDVLIHLVLARSMSGRMRSTVSRARLRSAPGHVKLMSVMPASENVLDDHVHAHRVAGQRREHLRGHARHVGDSTDGELHLGRVVGDAVMTASSIMSVSSLI